MECHAWTERRELAETLDCPLTENSLIDTLLSNEEGWNFVVTSFVERIMTRKEMAERECKRERCHRQPQQWFSGE